MTIIKARLNDQVLTTFETPVIASGGVEEDTVFFEFDDTWTGYAKKAVFYRDKSNVYHVTVGADNTAVVPWEVLQRKGFMFFGVFGTKGSEIKTSTVARYRVENGAITIGSESQPTPNIYADIIANTAARHTHDNKDVLDGITADKIDKWDKAPNTTDSVMSDTSVNAVQNKVIKKYIDDNAQPKGDYALRSELFSGSYNDLEDKPEIPAVPTDAINANTAARHSHDNKTVLDGITSEKVTEWNNKVSSVNGKTGAVVLGADDIKVDLSPVEEVSEETTVAAAIIDLYNKGDNTEQFVVTISPVSGDSWESDASYSKIDTAARDGKLLKAKFTSAALPDAEYELTYGGTDMEYRHVFYMVDGAVLRVVRIDIDDTVKVANIPTSQVDLSAYRKAADQDAIDATKQGIITDLETIRSGAALGATAVQPEAGKGLFSGSYNDLKDKPEIPTVPTDEINANTAARHSHNNKTVLDGITAEQVAKWNNKVSSVNGKTGTVNIHVEDIHYVKESQSLDTTIGGLKRADAQMASDISKLQTTDASLDSRITAIETGDTPVTLYIYWESVVSGGRVSLTKDGAPMTVADFISKMQSGAKIIIGENNDTDSESSGFSNYRYKITDSTTASLAFDVANSFKGSNRTIIISGSSSTDGLMTGYQDINHDDLSDYSPLPEGSTPASKAWVEDYVDTKLADGIIIPSSTVGSTKRFKLTVDDSGTISATEVTT